MTPAPPPGTAGGVQDSRAQDSRAQDSRAQDSRAQDSRVQDRGAHDGGAQDRGAERGLIRAALAAMITARVVDRRAFALHRQGELGTYPSSTGQEAAYVGSALALDADRDWIVPQYREIPGLLVHGVPLHRIFLYYMGDPAGGLYPDRVRALPPQISVAAHLPHAVGLAWGLAHQGSDATVLACVGDGGTSEGDFHEACNLAALRRAPVIFFVVNNQWAISTPYRAQTRATRIADRAAGYGIPGAVIDGNDALAVREAVADAVSACRAGQGPVLIEALTYRVGPHSTTDDPSRYQDGTELREWEDRDPIARLEALGRQRGCWSEADSALARDAATQQVEAELSIARSLHRPSPAQIFDHVYDVLPLSTARQQSRLEAQVGQWQS